MSKHPSRLGRIGPATLVVALWAGLVAACGDPSPAGPPPATSAPARAPAAPVATPDPAAPEVPRAAPRPADLQVLKGRWQRQDGGYVLEIRAVRDDGELDASYVNPRPIRVFKAEASQAGEDVRVFVELRDVNYPGSTYDLRYDRKRDVLEGIYFQAAQKQRFDVTFLRMR